MSILTQPIYDDLIVIRRIVDRGLKLAVEEQHTHFVDVFQHLQDELQRIVKTYENTTS